MTAVIDTLLATAATLAFNIFLAFSLSGVGQLAARAFGARGRSLDRTLHCFWIGYAIVQTFLVLWNFVFAVRPVVFGIVAAAGALGHYVAGRYPRERDPAMPRWVRLLAVLFCVWVANLSLASVTYFDTALYHMQAVRWAAEYPVAPGLANLFGPLGFNSAAWLFDAMVAVGPWAEESWHVSSGALISVLGVQLILAAGRFQQDDGSSRSLQLFALLLLPFVVNSPLDGRASSYTTIVPASLLLVAAALSLLRALADASLTAEDRAFTWFSAVLLSVAAVAAKSSTAIFAASVMVVSWWGLHRTVRSRAWERKALIWSLAAVLVVGLSWAGRGAVLSGYPLFPSPALSVPADWKAPVEHARAEFDFVRHSALATAENFPYVSGKISGITVWFRHWAASVLYDLYDMVLPGLLGVIATIALAVRFRRNAADSSGRAKLIGVTLVPPVIATIAWWLVAPMPHYGAGFFWIGAATLGTLAAEIRPMSAAGRRRLLAAACVFGFSPSLLTPAWAHWNRRGFEGLGRAVLEENHKYPDPGRLFAVTPRPQGLERFTTRSGLVLTVPTGKYGRCWYEPLPCTPNPAPNLRLRAEGRLDRGFTVDGEDWQMIGWPEPWRHELLPAMREGWKRRN